MEYLGAIILGWLSGMVVNYLSDVLPIFRRFSVPVCSTCGKQYSWGNYLLLGKCGVCGNPRLVRTWIVQIGMTGASLWFVFNPPGRLGYFLGLLLLAYFAMVAVIDLEHKAILLPTSIVGALAGLLIGWRIHGLEMALLGGAAGGGIMFVFYQLGILFIRTLEKIRKVKIEEVALGQGDVYLMIVLGLMMGWPEVIGGMLIGFLAGGLISGGIILGMAILRRYNPLTAVPYAPFLLLGAIIMIYIPAS